MSSEGRESVNKSRNSGRRGGGRGGRNHSHSRGGGVVAADGRSSSRGGRGSGRGGRGRGARGRGGRGGQGRTGGRGDGHWGKNKSNQRGNGVAAADAADGQVPQQKQQRQQKQQQQQPQGKQSKERITPPLLKNGEKGAETHTVSESERIRLTEILLQLRETPIDDGPDAEEVKFEFPSTLTNTERKFVHFLAPRLGLHSKSHGKGENRRLTVYKRMEKIKHTTATTNAQDELFVPMLRIGKRGLAQLQKHVRRFPPTHKEELESQETGASFLEMLDDRGGPQQQTESVGDGDKGDRISAALTELGLIDAAEEERRELERAKMHDRRIVSLERREQENRVQRAKSHAIFQQQKLSHPLYKETMENRARLPAFARQEEIIGLVARHPVTVIQGETGCGKSTQCPQFLLDAIPSANIVVTQPRRISAIAIAERIAQEQCQESVGGLVGYQIRLESAIGPDTQLVFLTPGVLIKKLRGSPTLAEYTHIIIDEVHERDRYTEFLLIALRDVLPKRPDLRVILMSATLQTETLLEYFGESSHPYFRSHPPAKIEIEGRTFPVQEFFLEDVLQMTKYIMPSHHKTDDTVDDGGIMTNEELEAELAKVLEPGQFSPATMALPPLNGNGNSGESSNVTDPSGSVTGVMSSEKSQDHIDLGMHVTLTNEPEAANRDMTSNSAAQSEEGGFGSFVVHTFGTSEDSDLGGFGGGDDVVPDFDADFDDYDVDGEPEISGYDLIEEPDTTSNHIADSKPAKWDGVGLFQNTTIAPAQADLTAEQEDLLNQYQASHDDEQIDFYLLLEVLRYINESSYGEGAILVFLPGWQEISEFNLLLETSNPFRDSSKFLILPLHSGIPSSEQRRVLQRPPRGVRKIVLSTNIAETSLTIDDVSFVVDTGRAKEKDYDPHLKTSTLQATWISKSSSNQRKGRAGRTKTGVCFHLFSSRRFLNMRPFVDSEFLRTPLEEICLLAKRLRLAPGGSEDDDGIPAFLLKAVSPPHERSIKNSLDLLVDLGAMMPETNELTDLGHCLSALSFEPRVGKMVVWSYLLGCAQATTQMAVAMSYKTPFILPPSSMRKAAAKAQLELSGGSESDQVTVLNAIRQQDVLRKTSQGAVLRFCRENFLSVSTMRMLAELRKASSGELVSLGFPDPMKLSGFHNRHNKKEALWTAAISAGLYQNVAMRKRGAVNFSTMTNRKAKIHVSSVNALKGQPLNTKCQIPEGEVEFVCFGEMVRGTQCFTLSQTTHLSSPLPLLLLCGTSLSVHPDEAEPEKYSILNLDNWVVFKCDVDAASQLVVLRRRLESAFWNSLSEIISPSSRPNAGRGKRRGRSAAESDAIETLAVVLESAVNSTIVR